MPFKGRAHFVLQLLRRNIFWMIFLVVGLCLGTRNTAKLIGVSLEILWMSKSRSNRFPMILVTIFNENHRNCKSLVTDDISKDQNGEIHVRFLKN